jgi:hypothetical protein
MAAAGYSGRAIARELQCSHSYISRILAANPPDALAPVRIDARADGTVTLRTSGDVAVLAAAVRRALAASGIAIAGPEAPRHEDGQPQSQHPVTSTSATASGQIDAFRRGESVGVAAQHPRAARSQDQHVGFRRPRVGLSVLVAGVTLAAVLALGLFGERGHDAEGVATDDASARSEVSAPAPPLAESARIDPTPTVAAAISTASPAPTASPPPPAQRAPTLTLVPRVDTNVRVAVDGAVVFAGMLPADQPASWDGSRNVEVWTDTARDLLVTVNGHALGPLSTAVGHPDWNTVDWAWSVDWAP